MCEGVFFTNTTIKTVSNGTRRIFAGVTRFDIAQITGTRRIARYINNTLGVRRTSAVFARAVIVMATL
jgi:hypothetical protein